MATLKNTIRLSLAELFTETPGSRNVYEGAYSGEEFLNKILLPNFIKALGANSLLYIDLDNTEGFATSFLEEAFGGLARKYDSETVLEHLDFKSDDEPLLIEEIKTYIREAKG